MTTKKIVDPDAPVQPRWSEQLLASALARQHFRRTCTVLIPNCEWTGHEIDLLAVTKDLRIIDVEIKISRADLKADPAKRKWYHRYNWRTDGPQAGGDGSPQCREFPQKVWKHYYCFPRSLWIESMLDSIPAISGILLVHVDALGDYIITELRSATANREAETLTTENVMHLAKHSNLRYWTQMVRAAEMKTEIARLRQEVARLQRETGENPEAVAVAFRPTKERVIKPARKPRLAKARKTKARARRKTGGYGDLRGMSNDAPRHA